MQNLSYNEGIAMLDETIFKQAENPDHFQAVPLAKRLKQGNTWKIWIARMGGDPNTRSISKVNAIRAIFKSKHGDDISEMMARQILAPPVQRITQEEIDAAATRAASKMLEQMVIATPEWLATALTRAISKELKKEFRNA